MSTTTLITLGQSVGVWGNDIHFENVTTIKK